MKKVYVYDEETKEMVLQERSVGPRVHDIMCDLPDFVSTVDGGVIHGRRGLREHDKKHNTTNVADYKDTWANFQKKREAMASGKDKDKKRTEAVARAYNHLEEQSRRR